MTKRVMALVGLSLIMGGCAQQGANIKDTSITTNKVEPRIAALQNAAFEMTGQMLSSSEVMRLTQKNAPIVFVESIKNRTAEHIDTTRISEIVRQKIADSGQFRFVEPSQIESVRKQLDFEHTDGLVNQAKAIKFGKMIGAEYMLYGQISSEMKNSGSQTGVYYKMTMRLMALDTGLMTWSEKMEVRKPTVQI